MILRNKLENWDFFQNKLLNLFQRIYFLWEGRIFNLKYRMHNLRFVWKWIYILKTLLSQDLIKICWAILINHYRSINLAFRGKKMISLMQKNKFCRFSKTLWSISLSSTWFAVFWIIFQKFKWDLREKKDLFYLLWM